MLNLEGEEERKMMRRLTLGELEAFAGLGLTGLLTFNDTRVAGHEAFCAKGGLVLGVDFHQSAGDGETEGLGLAFVTSAVDVDSDVIFLNAVKCLQGLKHDILEDGGGEVFVEGTTVVVAIDGDCAVAFLDNNAGDGGFTAAYCIN